MIRRENAGDDLFLVTGATGKTGAPTVRALRERGLRVRALVHTQDDRSEQLADQGAEVVQGDLLNFASVRAATDGVTAAYFNYPPSQGYIEAAVNVAQAATDNGVDAVVELSQIGVRPDASYIGQQHWIVERLFDRTPLGTTHLRPTLFMDWLDKFWVHPADDEAVLRMPLADVPCAPIAHADIANVVAGILQDPEPHDGHTYDLFGAEELDWSAIAAKAQDTLGVAVSYQPIEISTMVPALIAGGVDPAWVRHLSLVAQDYLDGYYSGFNNVVETIGGSRPTTVEEYVADNREVFDSDGVLAITDARLSAA